MRERKRWLFGVYCPIKNCPERGLEQTATFTGDELKQLLESESEVRIFGPRCGHEWPFSKEQRANLKKACKRAEFDPS